MTWPSCSQLHAPEPHNTRAFCHQKLRSVSLFFGYSLGKQKATALPAWSNYHELIWPGYKVPTLLEPLTTSSTARNGPQFFSEQTVPTGLLFSILAFGLGSKKRQLHYRALTATGLLGLTRAACQLGTFKLVTTPIGQPEAFAWPMPQDTCLPLVCYVHSATEKTMFTDTWSWESQACSVS